MWLEYVALMKKYRLFLLSPALIALEISSQKVIFCGQDREGHPCLIMRTRLNNPKDSSEESLMAYFAHILDQANRKCA